MELFALHGKCKSLGVEYLIKNNSRAGLVIGLKIQILGKHKRFLISTISVLSKFMLGN